MYKIQPETLTNLKCTAWSIAQNEYSCDQVQNIISTTEAPFYLPET